jgi:hypothetical protein
MQTQSITIHATYDDILLPSLHLRDLLSINHVSEDVILNCETALIDLLKQIVDHACNGDAQQLITVNIAYNGSGVYIETQDEGIPVEFAVNKVIAAKNLQPASADHEPPKDIIDEVWYEVDMGKNIWQLVKYTS